MKILLINPPVYDFKLYDEWMKPLSLYQISHILKENDFEIAYINCLDRFDKSIKQCLKTKKYNIGYYPSSEIDKPDIYKNIKRKYKRYGISKERIAELLSENKDAKAVLITSLMTYWYPGVFEVINLTKEIIPNAKVFLGGVYATLCFNHAKKFSNTDYVFKGQFSHSQKTLSTFFDALGIKKKPNYQILALITILNTKLIIFR